MYMLLSGSSLQDAPKSVDNNTVHNCFNLISSRTVACSANLDVASGIHSTGRTKS
ncbi:unnamed protein product [Ixodes pacificus]